jgi:hypothetical protein
MFDMFRRRLTFANVTSALALFFALGGSAFAAVVVTSNDDVAPDTIAGHKPGPGKHANLVLGSVTNEDLAPETVKTGRITDGTVGLRDLGADSVDGTKIVDRTIGRAEIAPNAVGGFELAETGFYGVGHQSAHNVVVGAPPLSLPLTSFESPVDIIGRCSEPTPGAVTARVIMKSNTATNGVDSTAPGGVNDVPSVPPGTETVLASLGPTTAAHVATGSFAFTDEIASDSDIFRPILGTVMVATHVGGADCQFGIHGIG